MSEHKLDSDECDPSEFDPKANFDAGVTNTTAKRRAVGVDDPPVLVRALSVSSSRRSPTRMAKLLPENAPTHNVKPKPKPKPNEEKKKKKKKKKKKN
jgi:hypothetical protein